MQALPWERPLPVGKSFRYIAVLSAQTITGDTVTSVTVSVPSGVTAGTPQTDGANLTVLLTGVTVGRHEVEFNYVMASGASGCIVGAVRVVEC